jgi:hypothetical protein
MHHCLHHADDCEYAWSSRVHHIYHDLHHQHSLSICTRQRNCVTYTSVDQLLAKRTVFNQ